MSAVTSFAVSDGTNALTFVPGDQKPGFQSYLEKSSAKPMAYSRLDISWSTAQKAGETDKTTIRVTQPMVASVNGVDTLVHKDLFVGQFYMPMTASEAERDRFFSTVANVIGNGESTGNLVRNCVVANNRPY